jgi:hypothetical protein
MTGIPLKRTKCGAYVAQAFAGEKINFEDWQLWRRDDGMQVETTPEGLRVYGTTEVPKRAFSGLVSKKLYPADAVLLCELKICCEMKQPGTWGAVVHLCNRLVGDEIQTLEIPDNNGEITFAHFVDRVGWFRWYNNQSGRSFYKWRQEEKISPPLGSENTTFTTVRLSYCEPEALFVASLQSENKWIEIGTPTRLRKTFSAIELKIDAQAEGMNLDVLFRNCRLYPQPERAPVGLYIGRPPRPMQDVLVELVDENLGQVISSGTTDEDGIAHLPMKPDLVYPLGGRFKLQKESQTWETEPILRDGVKGIYPGDFYAINPNAVIR